MEDKLKYYTRLPLFVGLAICAGIFIGAEMFGGKHNRKSVSKNASKMKEVLRYLDKYYVDTVDTEKLTEKAIKKMLHELDPHSSYIPAKDIKSSNEWLQGNFEGIGIEFNIFRDTLYVVTPLKGGPSEKAGLQSGDKIIMVDGKNIADDKLTTQKVFKYLKGEKGTKVKISVMRQGSNHLLDFVIKRDKIPIFTVDAGFMLDEKIGYIKINRFGAKTYDEFKDKLAMLQVKKMSGLIVDLRNNPGGYMDAAIKIVDEFLEKDKVIVFTKGKDSRSNEQAKATSKGSFENGKLIILVNEGSASASEIVSGALQDHDRALIIGRRTFGKGLVQKPIKLNDGSELRLTISRYYTPSGRLIQRPYERGNIDRYSKDYAKRLQAGESFYADSSKSVQAQQYKTANGRVVYGGRGIKPDYLVPKDTSHYNAYLQKLYVSNLVREFALKYVSNHKETLKQQGLDNFCQTFKVDQNMLSNLVQMAEKADIKYHKKQFNTSQSFLKSHIKSLIARSIWKNEGLYKILLQDDKTVLKALSLFERMEEFGIK